MDPHLGLSVIPLFVCFLLRALGVDEDTRAKVQVGVFGVVFVAATMATFFSWY